MGIYDVGYGGFGAFQSDYRINNIPKAAEVKPLETVTEVNESSEPQQLQIEEVTNRQKSVNPNEVSLSFNKNDDYSYIGKDKDIENLDMEKAISEMRQDSILQEYQYFVGNTNTVYASADGVVIAK